jgi:hypothetical protein
MNGNNGSRSLLAPFKNIEEANNEFHKITKKYNEDLQTIKIRSENIARITQAHNDYMNEQEKLFNTINENLRIANEQNAMINDEKPIGGKKRKTRKVKKGKKTKKSKKSRKYKK